MTGGSKERAHKKTIGDVLQNDNTRPFIAGFTDVGVLLAKTRQDGHYTHAMYDCEMAIMQLVHEYVLQEKIALLNGCIGGEDGHSTEERVRATIDLLQENLQSIHGLKVMKDVLRGTS